MTLGHREKASSPGLLGARDLSDYAARLRDRGCASPRCPRVAVIVCGALGKEVKELVEERGWEADIYGVPALLHYRPRRIVEEVERRLEAIASRYERVIAVYGDCGTAGALDAVLARYGAVRLAGAHCYEMLAGADEFASLMEAQPGTFFLTDWLVRSFDRAVVRGLGIDRFPELQPVYFGNYARIVYLAQSPTERLLGRAREIAAWFTLPLEVRVAGLTGLEIRLEAHFQTAGIPATP